MPPEVASMHRAALAVALAPLQPTLLEGGMSCRHPLSNLPCLLTWFSLSVPFIAAGGIYSLLALRRRRRGAPSRIALVGTIGFGFVYAFLATTALVYLLDALHLSTRSFALEIFEYLVWVLVWQALYVRLVIRLWVWLWG
jgi:hypothetical protein